MATEKRQRQDARRAQKVQEVKAVQVKQQRARKAKRWAWIGVPAAALIAAVLLWPKGSSTDTAADTTLADSGVPTSKIVVVPSTISKALSTKPEITIPKTDPPKTLQIKDLVVGKGPEVVKGSNVKVQYVGKSWSNGKQFDASWDRTPMTPFAVDNVGEALVIDGWNQGLIGARQGSRRQVIIPPDLAYGKEGSSPNVGPNETLVFIMDIVDVQPPATATTAAGGGASTTAAVSSTSIAAASTTAPAAATVSSTAAVTDTTTK